MKKLLFFTLFCVLSFCSCSNNTNSADSKDFADLIEQCNKDIKSGGYSHYYTGTVDIQDDTLFLSVEANEAKYSAKMVQIRSDELAKKTNYPVITNLFLLCSI